MQDEAIAPGAVEPLLAACIASAKAAFGHEPWSEIEFYLEKGWSYFRNEDAREWAQVRDHVRSAWNIGTDDPS